MFVTCSFLFGLGGFVSDMGQYFGDPLLGQVDSYWILLILDGGLIGLIFIVGLYGRIFLKGLNSKVDSRSVIIRSNLLVSFVALGIIGNTAITFPLYMISTLVLVLAINFSESPSNEN
jgi:O-antigen ligase